MLVKVLMKCYLGVTENGALNPRICNPGDEVDVQLNSQDVVSGLYIPMSASIASASVANTVVKQVELPEPELPVVDDEPEIIQPVQPAEPYTDEMLNRHVNTVKDILETTLTEYDEKGRVERGIRSMDRVRRHVHILANGGVNFKAVGSEPVEHKSEILSSAGMPISIVKKENGDIDVARTLGFKVVGGA